MMKEQNSKKVQSHVKQTKSQLQFIPIPPFNVIHTFSRAPSIPQLIVYVVSLVQFLIAYIIIQHQLLSTIFRIAFLVIYSVTIFFKIFFTFVVSFIDPSDSLMILSKSPESPSKWEKIQVIKSSLTQQMFCRQCLSFVKPKSKHCRKCNRCVQEFDHHCIWVNNCVGAKNYKWFISMLYAVQIQMTMYMAGCAYLWSQRNFSFPLNQSNDRESYPFYEICIVWVSMGIVCVLWLLNLNLLILHMYLCKKGLTTYEWLFPPKQTNQLVDNKQQSQNHINNNGNQNSNWQNHQRKESNISNLSSDAELSGQHFSNVKVNKVMNQCEQKIRRNSKTEENVAIQANNEQPDASENYHPTSIKISKRNQRSNKQINQSNQLDENQIPNKQKAFKKKNMNILEKSEQQQSQPNGNFLQQKPSSRWQLSQMKYESNNNGQDEYDYNHKNDPTNNIQTVPSNNMIQVINGQQQKISIKSRDNIAQQVHLKTNNNKVNHKNTNGEKKNNSNEQKQKRTVFNDNHHHGHDKLFESFTFPIKPQSSSIEYSTNRNNNIWEKIQTSGKKYEIPEKERIHTSQSKKQGIFLSKSRSINNLISMSSRNDVSEPTQYQTITENQKNASKLNDVM